LGGFARMTQWATFGIVVLSVACVISRPFGVKEYVPAIAGAVALVVLGLLPVGVALQGLGQAVDVVLFLTGMMLLAELARGEGLFDWLAAGVAVMARGSAMRLFALVYGMAVLVTVFLSNDATAVVFTPAVAAMARAVQATRALPYLLICAFVANAASFVLPISNPANLVVYAHVMPPLLEWLRRFGLASAASIGATYLALWLTQRGALQQEVMVPDARQALSRAGRMTGCGIIGTALVLIGASAFGLRLGAVTFVCGFGTAMAVLAVGRQGLWRVVQHISWGVLPLVAGLFVMVAALDRAGVASALGSWLGQARPGAAFWGTGLGVAVATNFVNNLPAGLLMGQGHLSGLLTGAALVGVDLGPNLSVTGSLATILWLTALEREGAQMTAWQFLRLGAVVMPPALVLALLAMRLTL